MMHVLVVGLSVVFNVLLVISVFSINTLLGNYSEYLFAAVSLLYIGNLSLVQGITSTNSVYVDMEVRVGVARKSIYRAMGNLSVLIASLIIGFLFRNNLVIYFVSHTLILVLTLLRAPQLVIYLNEIMTKRLNLNSANHRLR